MPVTPELATMGTSISPPPGYRTSKSALAHAQHDVKTVPHDNAESAQTSEKIFASSRPPTSLSHNSRPVSSASQRPLSRSRSPMVGASVRGSGAMTPEVRVPSVANAPPKIDVENEENHWELVEVLRTPSRSAENPIAIEIVLHSSRTPSLRSESKPASRCVSLETSLDSLEEPEGGRGDDDVCMEGEDVEGCDA
jgi:hypothetical protein